MFREIKEKRRAAQFASCNANLALYATFRFSNFVLIMSGEEIAVGYVSLLIYRHIAYHRLRLNDGKIAVPVSIPIL